MVGQFLFQEVNMALERCEHCLVTERKHASARLTWPETIHYGVHLGLEHKVTVNEDGTVMVEPPPSVGEAQSGNLDW